MTRREIREEIFKTIFQVEFHNEDEMSDQMDTFLTEGKELKEEDLSYIQSKANDIIAKLPEIDKMIDESSEGWKTSRMAKVDLSILRVATYEIKFENLAEGIAINEAVEIAKKYGSDSSPAFINGILAKVV